VQRRAGSGRGARLRDERDGPLRGSAAQQVDLDVRVDGAPASSAAAASVRRSPKRMRAPSASVRRTRKGAARRATTSPPCRACGAGRQPCLTSEQVETVERDRRASIVTLGAAGRACAPARRPAA
jgi:hypothetical protein